MVIAGDRENYVTDFKEDSFFPREMHTKGKLCVELILLALKHLIFNCRVHEYS